MQYFIKLILISMSSLLLIGTLANGQQPVETKRVLILMTGQHGVPGYVLAEKGMRASLDSHTDFSFEYFIEYMDRYRFKDVSYQNDLLDLYRTKYSNKKLDLIIAYGYHALDFLAAHGGDTFPHTPIVFSAVLDTQLKRLHLDRPFTGSLLEIDYQGLLNMALKNHPGTRHVVIISGTSKVGRLIEGQGRKAYTANLDQYDFTYLGHQAMRDLMERLAKLPKHTVVIYFYLALDGKGEQFKPWKVASMVSKAANAPVYGLADTYMGHGIVGGRMVSYTAHGRVAGEIGLRILKGENPADIPRTAEGTVLNMFDWRQLKRWGIQESNLPEGSIVQYKERSYWELYKWYVIGVFMIVFIQGLLINRLIALRKKGLKNVQELRASDDRYKAFIKNCTEDIYRFELKHPLDVSLPEDEQIDHLYKYLYVAEANEAWAKSVGYEQKKDLLGTRIADILPRSGPENTTILKKLISMQYRLTDFETTEVYENGTIRIVANSVVGILEKGLLTRIWGTGRDITGQKQLERALSQSKKFTSTILNSIEDHIVVLDKHGVILTFNNSWMRFARENDVDQSLIGSGINYLDVCRRAIDGSQQPSEEQTDAAAALEGLTSVINGASNHFSMEYPCHSPTKKRWFQMEALPFKGDTASLVLTHRDISLHKNMEAQLINAERKYRTVADYTYDWEYWEATDGRLVYVSPSCERITGYTASEFMEQPELIFEIILPEDRDICTPHFHAGINGDEKYPYHCHFRIRSKNGSIRWIAHVCQPVSDENGHDQGVRVSNRDITKLRMAEQQVREHRDMLSNLDRRATLGQLAGSIAHEMNQPLTGILSDAQAGELLFKKGTLDAENAGLIFTDIVGDAKRASAILRNLRELFSDNISEFKSLSINSMVDETLSLMKSELIGQGVTIHKNLSRMLPNISGNRIQLQQVLINLIKNSMQAMQHLEVADRWISINATPDKTARVSISIEDNGQGIDRERLMDIFDPLYTTKPDGLGMGLAISHSIVQAHAGAISVENNPKGGASFLISLPLVEV